MPVLENPRHERFAQELAKGRSAHDAYVLAGYNENRRNAARLKAYDTVVKRVAELQSGLVSAAHAKAEKAAETFVVTVQTLMRQADECRQRALEAGQYAAAVSAIKELGILSGHRVEKREQRHVTVDDMSDADLAAIALGKAPEVTAH